MNSKLSIETLGKALYGNVGEVQNLIIYSDQISQYTSKDYLEHCRNKNITQSVSNAEYPYDKAALWKDFTVLSRLNFIIYSILNMICFFNQKINDYYYNG